MKYQDKQDITRHLRHSGFTRRDIESKMNSLLKGV